MASRNGKQSFYEIITAAVADFTANGYDDPERLRYWTNKIREAAENVLTPEHKLQETINAAMQAIYIRLIENGQILKRHKGVELFTLQRVAPECRAELSRRISVSANLIKLNRAEAIETTVRRFSGWASSIPVGGSKITDKPETKKDIRKSFTSLPFEERRVAIDQGHKFTSALNDILAKHAGALAGQWHSHWRQTHYNYRHSHKERDGKIYAIRPNWALDKKLMQVGKAGWFDEITQPGEEVYCRCFAEYIYDLDELFDLDPYMITKIGKSEMKRIAA